MKYELTYYVVINDDVEAADHRRIVCCKTHGLCECSMIGYREMLFDIY